jgi:uncharacterized protein
MAAHQPVTFVGWRRFETATRKLAEKIDAARLEPDLVLAINRGGAVAGVLLSHLLGVRDMLTFTIQMMDNSLANARRHEARFIGAEVLPSLRGRRVLLADDAVGSGDTLVAARAVLTQYSLRSLHTAASIWNRERHPTKCPADYFGGTTKGWVHFPWEKVER